MSAPEEYLLRNASDHPVEALVKPAPELSLLAKWRWNFLAALFAALLLFALTLRRWRRAEVGESSEPIEHGDPGALPRPGIALVSVLAGSGLAVALAVFPLAGDQLISVPLDPGVGTVTELMDNPVGNPVGNLAGYPAGYPVGEASADLKCTQCGVVESTREIAQLSEGSTRGVEVTVRMKDGASHLFIAASSANSENLASWRPGERVIFIDGRRPDNE